MSKFSDAMGGTRVRKPAELTLVNGEKVQVELRLLTPMETMDVVERATEYARQKKAAECADGNPIYDMGVYVHTLALAVVDPDVKDSEVPYFDRGADQILNSQILAPDSISQLFALYEQHVEHMSLTPSELDEAGLRRLIESSTKGDMLPFLNLRPGMQWSFVRSMAVLLHASPALSSLFSSGSASGTSDDSKKPSSNSSNPNNGTPAG